MFVRGVFVVIFQHAGGGPYGEDGKEYKKVDDADDYFVGTVERIREIKVSCIGIQV